MSGIDIALERSTHKYGSKRLHNGLRILNNRVNGLISEDMNADVSRSSRVLYSETNLR